MKTNFLSRVCKLSFLILFSLFFSNHCYTQSWEEMRNGSVLIKDGKSIYVGDVRYAIKDLNKILGIWEDGTGNKIRFYIAKNPYYKNGKKSGNSTFELFNEHLDFTHMLFADIEIGNFTNGFEAKFPQYFVNIKAERYDQTIYKGLHVAISLYYTGFAIVKNSYGWKVDQSKESPWGPGPVLEIGDFENKYEKTIFPDLIYNTGYITGKYSTYPIPFKKTSGHETTFEEVTDSSSEDEKKYALKVTPLTSDIKPDGETTVQISAQLYSYTPGDNSSSKPVAGKPLSIEINNLDRIKPGVLSATSATTDNNGIVTFNYTAPIAETLEQMEPMNRLGTTIKISNGELKVEDLAYISFVTDKGKIWVVPGMSMLSDTGFVPPDKRYPALISANFYEGNMEPIRNTDVIFSIRENNPVGMLCSSDGREGKQITLKTDANGAASVLYYYAASTPPDKRITETIEAKTTNMSAPFKAYVSTGFNLVINDAISGYESSSEINAGEEIPLKITVKDAWNPGFNLEEMMNHWGFGGNTGSNKLYVKLEIEKQGFVPGYLLDLMGEKNFPEPLYEEMLRPRNMGEFKNLLYIPEYSTKKAGFPLVKPQFSGVNNYEIRVLLTDEVGKTIFESPNPRRSAFLSIPTGVSADAFSIWFASNPLGPHTELARFARMLLSTISLGKYGGFGSILSLADAAFAINSGDAEALIAVLLSEIKGKVLGDVSENGELSGEIIGEYGNMSIAEQYLSYGLTTYSDLGLIAQMENKVLSGIAGAAFRSDTKMVVLKGDGTQKLFSTMESDSNSGIEIPVEEGKYVRDEKLKTISLKNGNVSVYLVPYEMNIISENASEMNIY